MAKPRQNSLYKQLLDISEEYFGPATERFLESQISHHLHKAPEKLTRNDIPQLIEWLRLTLTMLSSDQRHVTRYIMAVRQLGEKKKN